MKKFGLPGEFADLQVAVLGVVNVVVLGNVKVPKVHAMTYALPEPPEGVTVPDVGDATVPVYEFGHGQGLRTMTDERVALSVHAIVAVSLLPTSQEEGVMDAPETDASTDAATPIKVPATTASPASAVIPRRAMLARFTCVPM